MRRYEYLKKGSEVMTIDGILTIHGYNGSGLYTVETEDGELINYTRGDLEHAAKDWDGKNHNFLFQKEDEEETEG